MKGHMTKPVAIIMGSQSDWPTMRHAAETLDALGVGYDKRIVSAHRTPDVMTEYARSAAERGLRVIVAGAGGAVTSPLAPNSHRAGLILKKASTSAANLTATIR